MTPETTEQFLARMIIAVKEGSQIAGSDAMRLNDLASNGPGPVPVEVSQTPGAGE